MVNELEIEAVTGREILDSRGNPYGGGGGVPDRRRHRQGGCSLRCIHRENSRPGTSGRAGIGTTDWESGELWNM